MSRLMTGVLLVALLGLTAGTVWADRADNGVGGADITQYDLDPPPPVIIDDDLDGTADGFPLEATATFRANVLAYAHLAIDPPKDLSVPGDNPAGTPGEDFIDPEVGSPANPNPDAGLITAEFNTACKLSVEVTEFEGDGVTIPNEKLWTEYWFSNMAVKFYAADEWFPIAFKPPVAVDGWFQIANTFHNFGDADMPAAAKQGPIGTIVIDQHAFSPVANEERYMRLPFGVKAKNRIDADGTDFVYETVALAGDYTATMVATIVAP